MGKIKDRKMKLYREQTLVETLIKFRLRKYGFKKIKVECYNRFDEDTTKCRVEIYKNGSNITNRILKYESELNSSFVGQLEIRLSLIEDTTKQRPKD